MAGGGGGGGGGGKRRMAGKASDFPPSDAGGLNGPRCVQSEPTQPLYSCEIGFAQKKNLVRLGPIL